MENFPSIQTVSLFEGGAVITAAHEGRCEMGKV